jgi:hypothetical protein
LTTTLALTLALTLKLHRVCDRHQFPIAPDFARTAFSMQGQTLDAAIVDLNFDQRTSPVTAYVALSRVRSASHVLITHKFKLETFQQGVAPEADILLEYLRGKCVRGDIAARDAAKQAALEARQAAQREVRVRNSKKSGEHLTRVDKTKKTKRIGNWDSHVTKEARDVERPERLSELAAKHAKVDVVKKRPNNRLPDHDMLTLEAKMRKVKHLLKAPPKKEHPCAKCRVSKTVTAFFDVDLKNKAPLTQRQKWRNRFKRPDDLICLQCQRNNA